MSREGKTERGCRITEPFLGNTDSTLRLMKVSTKQKRIAQLSKRYQVLTTLHNKVDEEWLRYCFSKLRKSSSAGIDGEDVKSYKARLRTRLPELLVEMKSGRYQAPPVRRTYLPKGKGKFRPIGIPTTEDKLLQWAVKLLLEPIYEGDFYDFSYGFRPGKSQHQALDQLRQELMDTRGGCWIVEVDIKDFFGSMERKHLRTFLDQRVQDGVIRRLIDKWLKVGVMEAGAVTHPERGSPQGGVISPILSNVYLHEVVDKWYAEVIHPLMKGRSFMIRYADDIVMGFTDYKDARRMMKVLPKRFGKYGLNLHPEKTCMKRFFRPRKGGKKNHGEGFDFLGFTHYWGKSRKGSWVVKRKTAKSRLKRSLSKINDYCREQRHTPIAKQYTDLCAKMRGHYSYYGITANSRSLNAYYHEVKAIWRKWLARRGGSKKRMTWERFTQWERVCCPLPRPKLYHSTYVAKP